jgi:hypothetical protein
LLAVENPRWLAHDVPLSMSPGGTFYRGAAICRRKHVESSTILPGRDPVGIPEMCPTCGADVLVSCPYCRLRIRGQIDSHALIVDYDPPSFCDGCGSAYPWASRKERIYELENFLDEEDIDDADRVVISDNLRRLREEEALNENEQQAAWERIKRAAGGAMKSDRVAAVIEGLVSAAIRHQLGI